jgi:SpoVK/Ycf46/Vps4 family AAA+-type ATPase
MNMPDLSNIYLGPLEANDDDNLTEYFVLFGDFSNVAKKNRFIVVGPKGTGKSAIKKHLYENRAAAGKLTIDLDDSLGFSLSQLKTKSPAEIKNKMKGYLIALILNHLSSLKDIPEQDKTRFEKLKKGEPLIEKLLKPLSIKAGFVEYAIKDLFPKQKQSDLLKLIDPAVSETIREVLKKKDFWIIIDDIDTVFTSDDAESSLRFVEGLIYSASDLCIKTFKKRVWILLMLRSEIFEELLRKATELDKEMTYIWEIVWDAEALKKCLAERIRWAYGEKKGKPSWKYWTLLFDVSSEKEVESLQNYLLERIINGPRDLLLLVDQARETAEKRTLKKIRIKDIEDSEYNYGELKLRQITSNFQRIYWDIDLVIDRLFREGKQIYTRNELINHINNNLLTNPEVRSDFKTLTWLGKRSSFKFIQILYRTGCIGYWDESKRRYIYVLERSNPDKALAQSPRFKLHSALAEFLVLKPPQSRKKKKS